MKEQFIPYELALKLKELGFNELCFGYCNSFYKKDLIKKGIKGCVNLALDENEVALPLWQQAFDWFREKYLLHSSVDFNMIKEKEEEDVELYDYKINEQWSEGKEYYDYSYGFKHIKYESHFLSYKEARQACLEQLIKIVENGTL